MTDIIANAKNLRSLLEHQKFAIDYYQREYRWGTKQVTELIDDLEAKFSESYESSHERGAVATYPNYFLGSIIICNRDERNYIVDGQQRLTSLTLVLIHIYRLLDNSDMKSSVSNLIQSIRFGVKSFNIDVEERSACMSDLIANGDFDATGHSESVMNVRNRFQDIVAHFPDGLSRKGLPYFVDWLVEKVHVVEIRASSDSDAYNIFETMNDRGLSLSPTDMLKGYLLANIEDSSTRNAVNDAWRNRVRQLQDLGKEEDAAAIKSWLRSQYAKDIRERKRGAEPRDFDRIGTEFHRWVRDNERHLGLSGAAGAEFARFIREDFEFYGRQYAGIREAGDSMISGMESVHYCAQSNFTLQYPVLLAPLRKSDSQDDISRKIRVVSAFLDIVIARRMWNGRSISYSTMVYAMFLIMRDIRGKDANELVDFLSGELEHEPEKFSTGHRLRLHGTNSPGIHRLLARLTDFVETSAGLPSHYHEYSRRGGRDGYEIEHIWANHFEDHEDEFGHVADFADYRNHIGGLLLLPKKFNASYGDLPYAQKVGHYLKQNLLAMSLHEEAYKFNPGFNAFIKEKALPFKAHMQFQKEDLDARQSLYVRLAELVWDPKRLARIIHELIERSLSSCENAFGIKHLARKEAPRWRTIPRNRVFCSTIF